MPLTKDQYQMIKNKVKTILNLDDRIIEKRKDIEEGDTSPFLKSLFGDKRTLFVKVGQSIQTTMGMSFYEQTCKILGEQIGYKVELQKKVLGFLPKTVEDYLNKLDNISYIPNKEKELKDIIALCKKNKIKSIIEYPDSTVDVYITTSEGKEILIDITTVKPNKKEFRIMHEKTLRWASYKLSQNPSLDIETYFAFPYNPEGKTNLDTNYNRFSNYYDRKSILVGDQLWRKVSNNNCSIEDIIKIFVDLGVEMETKINDSFEKINLFDNSNKEKLI